MGVWCVRDGGEVVVVCGVGGKGAGGRSEGEGRRREGEGRAVCGVSGARGVCCVWVGGGRASRLRLCGSPFQVNW